MLKPLCSCLLAIPFSVMINMLPVCWMQTVELKVSMHCYGCAKKVQKHISKMDGMVRELILILNYPLPFGICPSVFRFVSLIPQ